MLRMLVPALAASITAGAAAAAAPVGLGDRPGSHFAAGRSEAIGANGMVATAQPLASVAALDVLRDGGTAVDAAIAANAMLALVEPESAGMGGDLFAIVWDPRARKLAGLNASGRASKGQTLEQLQARLPGRDSIPLYGSMAVTAPGMVDGWFALHARYGKLPMSRLLAPAIRYAREGFPVTEVVALEIREALKDFDRHAADIEELDNIRKLFTHEGRTPDVGERFRNPDLATSFELIARGGRDAFYRGPIAKTIDAYMRRIGGALRYDDLASTHSSWIDPVCTTYRTDYRICEMPFAGQGLAVLQMLNILEGYDLAKLAPGSADLLHLEIEAKRLAYEDRARYYADPDFAKLPLAGLLSKSYAAERRKLIDPKRAMPTVSAGDPATLEHGDTTYLTVADRSGMMVSLIQSNYSNLGSGLVPDGLGFVLHDRGNAFSLDPKHANAYAPGKRPFHTIIPGFAFKDDQPWLSFGVMGGAMQPQGQVQVLVNLIDLGMNLQQAGDAARFYHDGSTRNNRPLSDRPAGLGRVSLESGIRPEEVEKLRAIGHDAGVAPAEYGGYEAIQRDTAKGVYFGATELRKDGAALGY
ncbi:gamma-glutamyltransferase [Solimonas flava]|uniref:gamma-glutamyltransferase n=1 Tax=Solimonas flava TaxID=415849 RepID=UPI000408CB8E|nr:gamma-glutamyltransferase [Solimonas flava]